MGPQPAVAAVRRAVRTALPAADERLDGRVLVACSGGSDSLALAAATIFEAPRAGLSAGLDHRRPFAVARNRWSTLAPSRRSVTSSASTRWRWFGSPSERPAVRRRRLARQGTRPSTPPPRRSARPCCSAILSTTRPRRSCSAWAADPARAAWPGCVRSMDVTADPSSVSGERRQRRLAKPWGSRRGTTRPTAIPASSGYGCARRCCHFSSRCCKAGWPRPWLAPRRSRSRTSTRSTRMAESYLPAAGADLLASELADCPQAIRTRVLRCWLTRAGVPALTAVHLAELDALVARWHGQARVDLPGGFGVTRVSGRLCLVSPHTHKG